MNWIGELKMKLVIRIKEMVKNIGIVFGICMIVFGLSYHSAYADRGGVNKQGCHVTKKNPLHRHFKGKMFSCENRSVKLNKVLSNQKKILKKLNRRSTKVSRSTGCNTEFAELTGINYGFGFTKNSIRRVVQKYINCRLKAR